MSIEPSAAGVPAPMPLFILKNAKPLLKDRIKQSQTKASAINPRLFVTLALALDGWCSTADAGAITPAACTDWFTDPHDALDALDRLLNEIARRTQDNPPPPEAA